MTRWFGSSKTRLGRCRIIGTAMVAVCLAVSLPGVASAKDNEPGAEKIAPAEKEPAVQKPPAEADEPAKDKAAKDEAEPRRVGRVLSVALPIVSDTDRLVKRFVDRVLEDARKNHYRPVLILQLDVPAGKEQFGRGSQFGASLELARYLSSDALNAATTVAYIPRSIQGHAVLVALACDEIIMAPDASIGSAGIDEKTIEDFILAGYREIANRRRTVPVELALGMLDPSREVLEVETDVSREFVTPEGLAELRQRRTIAGQKVVIPKGEPGQFTGEQARRLGFVSYLATDRREAARALELPPESLEEDLSLVEKWRAIRVRLEGAAGRREDHPGRATHYRRDPAARRELRLPLDRQSGRVARRQRSPGEFSRGPFAEQGSHGGLHSVRGAQRRGGGRPGVRPGGDGARRRAGRSRRP